MPIKPSQALLAALSLIAAPAFAQDSAAPATPQAPAAETPAIEAPAVPAPATPTPAAPAADAVPTPAAPAADAAPAPAAPVPGDAPAAADAEPQVGQYYVKSTNQDWTTRCLKVEQGKDLCELYQRMNDAEGNGVAELTVVPLRNSEAAAGASLTTPLETDLRQGVGFAVGNNEPNGYPFTVCAPIGCIARMGFTQAELDMLKRGSTATVTLLPFGGNPDEPVTLDLSLAGFTAAFDALSAYADEPVPAAEAPAAEAPATDAPAADAPGPDAPAAEPTADAPAN